MKPEIKKGGMKIYTMANGQRVWERLISDKSSGSRYHPRIAQAEEHQIDWLFLRHQTQGATLIAASDLSKFKNKAGTHADFKFSDAREIENAEVLSDFTEQLNHLNLSSENATADDNVVAAVEGVRIVRLVGSIVRSTKLRKLKLAECWEANHGKLVCEICREEGGRYPAGEQSSEYRAKLFEVHHIKPFAEGEGEVENTTDGLAVLCANCHRAVHVDANVEKNFYELKAHFESQE